MLGSEYIALLAIAFILLLAFVWRYFTSRAPLAMDSSSSVATKLPVNHYYLLDGETAEPVIVTIQPEVAANGDFMDSEQS